MVKEEIIKNNTLIYHYSDQGFMIRQNETNILYNDAIDIIPCQYTYSETDIPIEGEIIKLFAEENNDFK